MSKSIEEQLQELSEDSQGEFYNTSYRFLKSTTKHFGSESETLIFEALQKVLGQEWANQLIMKKLSGDIHLVPEYLSIQVNSFIWDEAQTASMSPKINTIKAFRKITGMGLKESKDSIELAVDTGSIKVKIPQFMYENKQMLQEMQSGNFSVELEHLINECNQLLYSMKQYGVMGETS